MAVTERRTQIYLTEAQHAAVTRVARERGISLAAVVRDALDRYLTLASAATAPWQEDPVYGLVGTLELPPLAGDGGDAEFVEAIDRSVYDPD